MIDLAEYKKYIEERKNTFDTRVMSNLYRNKIIDAAAEYMDVITSSYGEKWDEVELCQDLDQLLDKLKSQGVTFFGNDISDRRTDKDDPNIIQYKAVVDSTKTVKDDDGTTHKVPNGKKEVTKKIHVHSEVKELYEKNKTNAFGIPATNIFGSFHRGQYQHKTKYDTLAPARDIDCLSARLCTKNSRAYFEKFESIKQLFFNEIDERQRYGLASLLEITVNEFSATKPAGLIRIDYEVDSNGNAYADSIKFCLNAAPFIDGYVTYKNLRKNLLNFVVEKLAAYNIEVRENETTISVYTDSGKLNAFIEKLKDIEEQKVQSYERAHTIQEDIKRRIEESDQAEIAAEEERVKARLAEKERLREERNKERIEREIARKQNAEERHAKAVEKTMIDIVTSLVKQNIEPSKEVFEGMLADVNEDIEQGFVDDGTEIVIQALNTLISKGA